MQQISSQTYTVALVGNPNSGKSSIFNQLTGLQQKTGNFPGVTVEKRVGQLKTSKESALNVQILDLPGTYSLYPNSKDERIAVQTLTNELDANYPDSIVYIADVTKLDKHLLLLSQIIDLKIPTLLVLNMFDVAESEGIKVNVNKLSKSLKIPVIPTSGRTGHGMNNLHQAILKLCVQEESTASAKDFYTPTEQEQTIIQLVKSQLPEVTNDYQALLIAHHLDWLPHVSIEERTQIQDSLKEQQFVPLKNQVEETMFRFTRFTSILNDVILKGSNAEQQFTQRLDGILTHRVFGPLIFLLLMVLVFQAIFSWSGIPQDWIEALFGWLGTQVKLILPAGWFTDLITDGLLAGLGGILIFIPQIAILFFLISILEEVGYMARAAFIFDRFMQIFGLNGKSIVALISGGACAIPAIMSTRTISNWKERFITIMVTPFISCSARIPVYTVLIGFAVPPQKVLGFLNLQGLAFMGLYILGIIAALGAALVFKLILKTNERSFLMLELPAYRLPLMRNVGLNVYDKVKAFVIEAGKIIIVISMVLWVMAYFGPGKAMENARLEAIQIAQENNLEEIQTEDLIASKQLEASFAGHLGKFIEPVIKPLGFDWKIGIALITSFAAREVFVGTMATIYSIGSVDDESSIKDQMAKETDPVTGAPIYTIATSMSLLIFYVFAMQCMSTLAVVQRETRSWKWPVIQFIFMTGLAYLSSFLVYQLLS
ncbi:MAG: ferrous iron transport protein B [Bacteroidota bacterium]